MPDIMPCRTLMQHAWSLFGINRGAPTLRRVDRAFLLGFQRSRSSDTAAAPTTSATPKPAAPWTTTAQPAPPAPSAADVVGGSSIVASGNADSRLTASEFAKDRLTTLTLKDFGVVLLAEFSGNAYAALKNIDVEVVEEFVKDGAVLVSATAI
eukprot:2089159-Rhodomonas_salina.1